MKFSSILFLVTAAGLLHALQLPGVFSDNMVIQRDQEIRIWGKGNPGDKVTVTFKNQKAEGIVNKKGNFLVKLPAFQASAEAAEMVVQCGRFSKELKNILVGDVWLCAGQSNMQWYIDGITEKKKYLSQIDQPNLRVFDIRYAWNRKPQFYHKPNNPKTPPATWRVSNMKNAQQFSAVGFITGLTILQKTGVPVGLISIAVGGGRIEAFCAPDSFDKIKNMPVAVRRNFRNSCKNFLTKKDEELMREKQRYPLAIYNGMITPILPFNIRGILWYQGEENYRDGITYLPKLKAFTYTMRRGFRNPELPIYSVMIPPWEYNNDSPNDKVPQIWMAQQKWDQSDPHSDLISTTDCGDVKSVHPMSKEPLALRLADLVLYREYGIGNADVLTPMAKTAKRRGKTVTVKFFNAQPLKTIDGKPVSHLEAAGADGIFHPASGTIKGDTLTIECKAVPEPVKIRFAYDCIAIHNLSNQRGIPAAPFELDVSE